MHSFVIIVINMIGLRTACHGSSISFIYFCNVTDYVKKKVIINLITNQLDFLQNTSLGWVATYQQRHCSHPEKQCWKSSIDNAICWFVKSRMFLMVHKMSGFDFNKWEIITRTRGVMGLWYYIHIHFGQKPVYRECLENNEIDYFIFQVSNPD